MTDDIIIELAVSQNLGRTLKPIGLDTGDVFYTDASYRTAELLDFARAIEALVRAECVPQWISVEDGLPPNDGDVLVWQRFYKCASVDSWSVQREDPLGMGGPTIEIGYDWREHHFDEISHWSHIHAAPGITAPQGEQQ